MLALSPDTLSSVALFRHLPELCGTLPWCVLGDWPTPVEPIEVRGEPGGVFVKREDISSDIYGGNKVRTLEAHIGRALAEGATTVWGTGAYGSNHVLATALHANRIGLRAGAILFPQPPTEPAHDNLRALLTTDTEFVDVPNVALLPLAMARIKRRESRAGSASYVMTPGGATPLGALGHVSAALELAEQIRAGITPEPRRIVLAVGSTCTTAGIVVGLHLARALGVAFAEQTPIVHAVRVTPWPVTARFRIAGLIERTARLVNRLAPVAAIDPARCASSLVVDRAFFGGGYGKPTSAGADARDVMEASGGPPLDVVYSAKSGAALMRLLSYGSRPLLFWSTKSSVPLPVPTARDLDTAPRRMRRWLGLPPARASA